MDGPRDYYTLWNKSEKADTVWYHLYEESKKYRWMYMQNGNRLTDIESKFMIAKSGSNKLGIWD